MDVTLQSLMFLLGFILLNPQQCHRVLPHAICNIPREKSLLETDSLYLPAPMALDLIPSPPLAYYIAKEVKVLRDDFSIQVVLRAYH